MMSEQITFYRQTNYDDDFIAIQGTLADLLIAIPYLLSPRTKFIPPDFLLLEKLSKNHHESGIYDLRWQMKDLNLSVEHLAITNQTLIKKGYIKPVVPDWVIDELTWNAFDIQEMRGIPAQTYLSLLQKQHQIFKQLKTLDDNPNVQYSELIKQLSAVQDDIERLEEKFPIKPQYLFEGE